MAYKLLITPHADALLDRLVSYLLTQKQSPQAAGHLLDAVQTVYDRLAANPFQFPVSRDPYLAARGYHAAVTPGMRYVLLFQIEAERVVVHGVFHGSENYPEKILSASEGNLPAGRTASAGGRPAGLSRDD